MRRLTKSPRHRSVRACGLALAVLATGSGCGTSVDANTAGYSGPVNLRLDKFKDGDVRNESFDADRSITEESGNPYAVFLRDAQASLGRAPAAVVIDRITLTLAADTRGITGFEQMFAGVGVLYLATPSVTVNVGTVIAPQGAGPLDVTLSAGRTELGPIEFALLAGSFKVGLRIPASPSRPRSFDAKVSATLYFRALTL